MNRSLLIVIFNFMLLSILAIARFEKAPAPNGKAAAQNAAPMTEVAGQDIVSSLKDSLKSEADAKAGLAQLLEARANELARQRTRTEALEQETSRLQGEEDRLERLRKQLEGERDQLRDETIASQAREKLIQEQLSKREEELRIAQANALALLNEKGIAERDKAVMAEKLENSLNERKRLEGEIATLLVERRESHAETAKLAANVGELAEAQQKNTEVISQKIRQVTPLSPNEVFDHFRRNRASLRFTTRENGLLGESEGNYERYTVFVKDTAGHVVTLCETAGTPLRLATLDRLRAITATMMFSGGKTRPVNKVSFLRADPRIAAFPSDAATVSIAKAQPFSIEDSPLRFPTAVVVTAGGERYGEAPIRVISGTSRYIEVQTSIANVLFGSFVPSEGDLVFSESGNLIGFMVGSGRAICLADLTQTASIDVGAAFNAEQAKATAEMLGNMSTDDALPHGRL